MVLIKGVSKTAIAKRKGGNHVFSQAAADAVVKNLREGAYLETSAAAAGIDRFTLRVWLKKGNREDRRKLDTPYARFARRVRTAQAQAEMDDVRVIRDARSESWQAAAWRLERKYPERYGRKDRTDEKTIDAAVEKRLREMLDLAQSAANRIATEGRSGALPPIEEDGRTKP